MALKVVFIGVGGRGRGWLRRVGERAGFEPVGVVDPSEVARQKVKEKFAELNLPAFASVEEAAAEIEADAAIIAASLWTVAMMEAIVRSTEAGGAQMDIAAIVEGG